MVRTQAHMMLPATPHLTAESPPVAPEPMIEAVIVCVVEIGIAEVGRRDDHRGRGGLGREAVDRVEVDDLGARGCG